MYGYSQEGNYSGGGKPNGLMKKIYTIRITSTKKTGIWYANKKKR